MNAVKKIANKIMYLFAKAISKLHRPALKNCDLGKHSKVHVGSNCINVRLGRYSYLGDHVSACNVDVGAFSSIAGYCLLGGGVHNMKYVSTSPVFEKGGRSYLKKLGALPETEQVKTIIGNDVWIGEKSFLKAGLTVGDGAVIGAHSVVTHDVPPYAIVAGSPARILRYRFEPEVIEGLLQSKWWEWDDEKIKRYASLFDNPSAFLQKLKEDGELS